MWPLSVLIRQKKEFWGSQTKMQGRILSLPAPTPPKRSKALKQIHTNGFHRVDTYLQIFSLLFVPPNCPFWPFFFSNPPVMSYPGKKKSDISSLISLFFDPKQPQKYGFITYGLLRVPEKNVKKKVQL